jgi:hypothetical protein
MSLKMNLKVAALLCDEVRHNRPKFNICRKVFFWGPFNVKIKFFSLSFQRSDKDTPLKKLRGGHIKRFWRKKMFSPKSMSNLGRLTVHGFCKITKSF